MCLSNVLYVLHEFIMFFSFCLLSISESVDTLILTLEFGE